MAPTKRHDPDNPLADGDGNVWEAAVDSAAELVEMVETARQYQNNVQVLDTAKGLLYETLRLGQSAMAIDAITGTGAKGSTMLAPQHQGPSDFLRLMSAQLSRQHTCN